VLRSHNPALLVDGLPISGLIALANPKSMIRGTGLLSTSATRMSRVSGRDE
jgi:hypothetical protein